LTITLRAGTLPSGAVYNAQTYFNAIVERITATVDQGNVLWGQLDGTEPNGPLPGVSDQAGLWFGNPHAGGMGYWNDYNEDAAKYLPIPVVCGQFIRSVLRVATIQCGSDAADRIITTPDASGTMALTSDLIQGLGTNTSSGANTIAFDWDDRVPLYVKMTANMVINSVHAKDGLIQDLWLENASESTSTTYTLSITGALWPNPIPTLSPGVALMRVIDHVRLSRVAGATFAEMVAKNFLILKTSDATIPHPVSATGEANRITITMDAILAGGTLPPADFICLVNGNDDNVTSASYSGTTVSLGLAASMRKQDTVTIRYTGTSMKSVGGNTVPAFGPIAVDVTGAAGGIHNDRTPGAGRGAIP
jgi:hypothetical protein